MLLMAAWLLEFHHHETRSPLRGSAQTLGDTRFQATPPGHIALPSDGEWSPGVDRRRNGLTTPRMNIPKKVTQTDTRGQSELVWRLSAIPSFLPPTSGGSGPVLDRRARTRSVGRSERERFEVRPVEGLPGAADPRRFG